MKGPGKFIAFSTAGLGIAVLVAVAVALKPRIVEEFYIHELQSTDDERRIHAADALGEMKSGRAIPHLIRVLAEERKEGAWPFREWPFEEEKGLILTPVVFALCTIGKDAIPQLTQLSAELHAEEQELEGLSKGATFNSLLISLKEISIDFLVSAIQSRYKVVKRLTYEESESIRKMCEDFETPAEVSRYVSPR